MSRPIKFSELMSEHIANEKAIRDLQLLTGSSREIVVEAAIAFCQSKPYGVGHLYELCCEDVVRLCGRRFVRCLFF